MSKYEAVYFVGDNQAINRVRIDSSKMRNRGAFSGSLAALSTSAWPNYGLDVLNITMHTEVVIHLMNAYAWCWSKICGSLDEILSLTMGSYESKILNKF